MVLTQNKTPRDPEKFPTAQLFLLALVRVAEPIALTSIFPYAWQLVREFHVGDRQDASFYSGLLISAFSLAEALSGMYWGGLSDRIGRKPVLIMGCFGTIASLLIVGFSFNFWMALFGRAIGGALNGNIGVIQTMVAEIVTNPKHEPTAYAIMPFVWSVGIIIGPAVGGYFASPAKNFPDSAFDNETFRTFPYLLPNLICTVLMLASIIAAWLCLDETHPDMQPWSTARDLEETNAVTPLMATQGTTNMPAANLAHESSYGTFNPIREEDEEEEWVIRPDGTSRPASISSGSSEKWFTRSVMMLMIALGIFTYHSMTYDNLMPIFFEDDRKPLGEMIAAVSSPIGNQYGSFAGGLGLSVQQCGIILAFNGIIALFVQAVIFPLAASWLGIWQTFLLVTVLHPIAYFVVPFLVLLPDNLLYVGIYACLAVRNILSIVDYPLLLILIKEASPSNSCLGKINGLAASTGAACRCLASPIAGFLYAVGTKIEFTGLAWWASAVVAIIGALQAFTIKQEKKGPQHQVRPVAPCRFMPEEQYPARRKSSVIRIRVQSEQDDSGYGTGDERTPFASRVPRG
ncbi:permease of the major facilitator superfamily [Hortaea werneckii]|nr:permease of the major facilitator superfamily [Hortaea werneckii]KAI7322183.1 permease of the major facilitator superfamily [Hortaea werneckii]